MSRTFNMQQTAIHKIERPSAWSEAAKAGRSADRRPYLWAGVVGVCLGIACLISPWLALGGLLGVIFCGVGLARPTMLCYALVGATVLTSGIPRGILVPLLIPHEAILLLSLGLSFPVVMLRRQSRFISKPIVAALAILVSGTVILPFASYLTRDLPLTTSDIFSLLAPLKYILLFWLFANLIEGEADKERVVHWMLVGASVVALIGLMQGFGIRFISNLLEYWYSSPHQEEAEAYGRVTSVLRAWNALGTFLMINLILVVGLQGLKHDKLAKRNIIVATALCGACLLASGSYAGLLGLGMGLIIVKALDRQGMRMILILVVGLALSAFLLQAQISQRLEYQFGGGAGLTPQTLAYRFKVWQEVFLPVLGNNLLWGIRPTLGDLSFQYAESQYVFLLFRSGLISLLAHLAWVGITAAWLYRKIRNSQGLTRTLTIVVFAVLIVLSTMGLTNEVFTLSGAAEYFWILFALVAKE